MFQWLVMFRFLPPKLFTSQTRASGAAHWSCQLADMADTTGETQAWAPNPDVDGDWLEAVVVSRGDDGNVVLKTVANGAEHTCPADKLNLMNVLPEQVSA